MLFLVNLHRLACVGEEGSMKNETATLLPTRKSGKEHGMLGGIVPGFRKGSGSSTPRENLFFLVLLGLLAVTSYLPALWGEFVWDDFLLMKLEAVSRWGGIWQIWFDPVAAYVHRDAVEGHYWPLLYTTFWLEHKLWGFNPLGYHAVNLLLHFVNTALLWHLLLRLHIPGAWFAAAVFAVHPLHVESVAWIISRKDLLSAMFYMGAFFMWIRFTEASRGRQYATALALFGAALLCKSIAVTLPAALLIFHWWKNGRVTARDMVRVVPFFLLSLAITGFDTWFYKSKTALSFDYSIYERLLIASKALWFYGEKLLWPVDLAVIYPRWEIDATEPLAWLFVVATAAVTSLLWVMRGRVGRGPMACALFFAVTLFPTLGFIDYSYMGHSFVADRYQYLAGIGAIVLFAAAAVWTVQRIPAAPRWAVSGAGMVLIASLGIASWNQTGVYRNEVSLFKHVISLNPDSWGAHQNAGMALLRLNEFEEAEGHLRRSLEIFPFNPKAFRNLGEALKGQERYEESLRWYGAAAGLEPDEPLNHLGIGTALLTLERYPEAVSSMKRSLELQPDPVMVPMIHSFMAQAFRRMERHEEADRHFNLGVKLSMEMKTPNPGAIFSRGEDLRMRGLHEESLRWYLSAIEIQTDFALAYAGMGDSLYKLGRYAEAVSSMKRAIDLNPDLPIVPTLRHLIDRASLGIAPTDSVPEPANRPMGGVAGNAATSFSMAEELRERKHYEESIKWYRDTVDADPAFALAYAGMGDSLYRLGRHEEAVLSMKKVFELMPDFPLAPTLHYLIGEALGELGRYEEAQEYYENALRLGPNFSEALSSLAELLLAQGRYVESLEHYRKLERIEPENAAVHSQIGVALFKSGRFAESLASFERALSLDPTLEPARSYREQLSKDKSYKKEQ